MLPTVLNAVHKCDLPTSSLTLLLQLIMLLLIICSNIFKKNGSASLAEEYSKNLY